MAGEWKSQPLSSLLAEGRGISYGIVQPGAHLEDGVPIVRVADIRGGRIATHQPLRVAPEIEAAYARTRLNGGELLLTLVGTVGEAAVVPPELKGWNVARAVAVIPVREDIGAYWIKLALNAPEAREMIFGRLNTTVQATLNLKDVAQLPILLPEEGNREGIAHIIGALDNKIELNRRMNETLEAIARAIFKSWFVDFDPVRAKASGEPPESICRRLGLTTDILAYFPDRLVDSELGEIPDGWEMKAIEDVAKVVKGKSYKSTELAPSKTALVTLKSFKRGGGYRLDGLKEYTGSYKGEQEVFGGDLVIAYTDVTQAADVIGKPALVISDDAYDHLVISLDVAVVRPVRDEYRIYLYGVMSGAEFRQHTRAHTTGTTVLHLASNAVPGFKFFFPGEALVDAYASIAAPMFASIDERIAEGRTLGKLRDTLLPKLLSGELQAPVGSAEETVMV
ncbi:MAG: restriction endonuclease subunit S [Rhizobacter sp.]|nr:restriction endonuclease subunit S [Rhizobacter sp.]